MWPPLALFRTNDAVVLAPAGSVAPAVGTPVADPPETPVIRTSKASPASAAFWSVTDTVSLCASQAVRFAHRAEPGDDADRGVGHVEVAREGDRRRVVGAGRELQGELRRAAARQAAQRAETAGRDDRQRARDLLRARIGRVERGERERRIVARAAARGVEERGARAPAGRGDRERQVAVAGGDERAASGAMHLEDTVPAAGEHARAVACELVLPGVAPRVAGAVLRAAVKPVGERPVAVLAREQDGRRRGACPCRQRSEYRDRPSDRDCQHAPPHDHALTVNPPGSIPRWRS